MWLDLAKAALALMCMAVAATVLRRQLAAMDPAAKRVFYVRSTLATLAGVAAFAAAYYHAMAIAH